MSESGGTFTIEIRSDEEEEKLEESGTPARNYGRLDRGKLDALVGKTLSYGSDAEAGMAERNLLSRRRYWRCNDFLRGLVRRAEVGVASVDNYTVRAVNGGIASAVGEKVVFSKEHTQNDEQAKQPKSSVGTYVAQWKGFEMWKEILGTAAVNLVPDRPFSVYIFAKNMDGDDVPVYYFELEIDAETDRHYCVWELDNVIPGKFKNSGWKLAQLTAEFAASYQQVFFYLNWGTKEPRKLTKLVCSNLNKLKHEEWNEFLDETAKTSSTDAVLSVGMLLAGMWVSAILGNKSLSDIAGIIVATSSAEEYLPPTTMIFGSIARFYGNEGLSLHCYCSTNLSVGARKILIALLASTSSYLLSKDLFEYESFPDRITYVYFTALAIFGLLPAATSFVTGNFSHTSFPRKTYVVPKIYIEKKGFLRRVVQDCKPIQEFCREYTPLIHWQASVNQGHIAEEYDWGSPGAPPSWLCYFLSFPASSYLATKWVYGEINWINIICWFPIFLLCFLEQLLSFIGGLAMTGAEYSALFFFWLLSFPYRANIIGNFVARHLNSFILMILVGPSSMAMVFDKFFFIISKCLGLEVIKCRTRTMGRFYRLPLTEHLTTGRESNHCWKFGDYLEGTPYYRCFDTAMVNPRYCKLGLASEKKSMDSRHYQLWETANGTKYANPVLSCGDNTTAPTHHQKDVVSNVAAEGV